MALSEIIKTGEIIEEEKSGAIDSDFLSRWTDLTDQLSDEEVNALYYALKEEAYDADHTLFQQGDFNNALYFVNKGHLKLVCRQGNREILLKSLSDGQIAGEDTFFESSVCTTSLVSLSMVRLSILEKKAMSQWKDRVPGLESKLADYCHRQESAPDLLNKKGMDRRVYKRVALSGPVSIQILSGAGDAVGNAFRGSLSDISVGGMSFYIRTSKADTARLLLGRNLNVKFSLPAQETRKPLTKDGMVTGVKYHLNNEYSVHLKFGTMIDGGLLRQL
jgi:CRP-like cAMP-binding protein